MQKIVIITTILAFATAYPAYLIDDSLHYPIKSTITHSNQLVDHGSTYIHTPIVPVISSAKSTLTKSSQVVNHGGMSLVHAPVYSAFVAPKIATNVVSHTPVVPSPVLYSSPVLSVKTGDSATSHHSSTVHETVPVVNHLPLYVH